MVETKSPLMTTGFGNSLDLSFALAAFRCKAAYLCQSTGAARTPMDSRLTAVSFTYTFGFWIRKAYQRFMRVIRLIFRRFVKLLRIRRVISQFIQHEPMLIPMRNVEVWELYVGPSYKRFNCSQLVDNVNILRVTSHKNR